MSHSKQLLICAILGAAAAALTPGCTSSDEKGSPGSLIRQDRSPSVDTPADLQASCPMDRAELAAWFKSGTIIDGGVVTPADSLKPLNDSCDFYKWSWRMFLSQMSRSSQGYAFNSPPFFDLNDRNELISNSPGSAPTKLVRGAKFERVDRNGQAGLVSGVVMSQRVGLTPEGSLIYYAIHVNDVYAYMASGVNSGSLSGLTTFPTEESQRDTIVQYAKNAYHATLSDANALAMELKSSWVKADPTMDLRKYVTITADIPKYTRESGTKWTWDGSSLEKGVTLACVGYHLVGSTKNHPEMVWATFEHVGNAPNANYYYVTSDGRTVQKENWNGNHLPVQKKWLLTDGTSREQSMNQMRMEMKSGAIQALPGNTIGPANVYRSRPWGGAPDPSSAPNNTLIISLNRGIASLLASNDVRRNYFLVGATWTKNGVPNVGLQIPAVVGSLTLANSTMETYFQYKNCFDCHQGGNINGLSHIFGGIKPLPLPKAAP